MGGLKSWAKKAYHSAKKTVEDVVSDVKQDVKDLGHKVEDLVKNPVSAAEGLVKDVLVEPVKDAASSVGHLVTSGVKYVEGDKEAAKKELTASVDKAIQTTAALGTGGLSNVVAKNTTETVSKDIAKASVAVGASALQPVNATIDATAHTVEAGYYLGKGLITGDSENYKKAQANIAKAGGDMLKATVTDKLLGTGKIAAPGVGETSKQAGEMVTNYATGNFNAGSQNLENITGWDVDNSKAEAAAEAAQKAAEDEVKKANQIAENERKAKLFALRKQVGIRNVGVASVWGSGSASSSVTKDNQTGIILG